MARLSVSAIWNEIDLCENYLVCCMFEEAADLSSSILNRVNSIPFEDAVDDDQLDEMKVSASMVFVQSMKELQRTQQLFVELRTFFGSAAAIPVQVFLTGACMQISEGHTSNLRAIFEEFLSKWKYVDNDTYVLAEEKSKTSSDKRGVKKSAMSSNKYLEVAEVYTITLLGMVFHNLNFAISWTEKASLPEENRKILLTRLHSLLSVKPSTSRSEVLGIQKSVQSPHLSSPATTPRGSDAYPKTIKEPHSSRAGSWITQRRSKILDQLRCCFWWFHTFHTKVGRFQLVLPSGKHLLLGALLVFTYYMLRRRRASWKWLVANQASAIKRALVDAWQLAFNVQVNPLAAIQQLPSAPHGNMR